MAGQSGLNCDLRGLCITDFTNHDNVGILPQDGPQCARKRDRTALAGMHLVDQLQRVFDRIFDCDDVRANALDKIQG